MARAVKDTIGLMAAHHSPLFRRAINLFEPIFAVEECLAALEPVLRSGWTAPGDLTLEFEKAWCAYTGLPHAHFVSSATAGLHLALHVLTKTGERGLRPTSLGPTRQTEVVTTPLTFVSTNHVILHEGLMPRFADVDSSLCLAPDSVGQRITDETAAAIFVGIGGNTGRLLEVAELCKSRGVPLILDAAHMAGTRWNQQANKSVAGRHVGSEADAAVFSFQSVKNLPTGDGGMVCFRNAEDDRLARQLSWLGIDRNTHARSVGPANTYRWRYDVPHVGWKYQGNAIAAALGMVGLRHLDAHNAYRRQLARLYDELLPELSGFHRVEPAFSCESSRHLYQVCVPDRDRVIHELNWRDIYPGVHYVDNRRYPMYAFLHEEDACPNAEQASDELLSLPLHCRMTHGDVVHVANALREILS
jgi:dTDP-4-amino-4,6-dideoxygalactose transaminase